VPERAGFLAVAEGTLYSREADGTVWAIDPATGSARWKTESGIAGDFPVVFDGNRLAVAGQGLAMLALANGAILWTVPAEVVATALPVAAGPCLLVAEEGGLLRCRAPDSGNSLWTWKAGGTIHAPAVVDDEGRILLGTAAREFVAVRLDDGGRRWRWKLGADVRTKAALLGEQVVFASHEAVLYALRRGNGNLSWRATIPSRTVGAPLVLGDGVIVTCYGSRPDENLLVGFDGRSGRRLGEMRTPGEIESAPLLVGDRLLLALREPRLIALQLAAPSEPEPSPTPSPVP
jgi:outer membrane protein assembly factor BamB